MAANIPDPKAGETSATNLKAAQAKLPKHILPLPDDIPEREWKLWPRQIEAHLLWPQARERQITQKVRSGTLACYYCPDGSCRIKREHMVALWGEPDEPRPNPLSAAGRELRGDDGKRVDPRRVTDADLDLDDPIVGMFRECREMLRASNDFNLQLIKALMAPIAEQMGMMRELAERFANRVTFLEERSDAVMLEREALADFRHQRDLETSAAKSREERRGKVLSLLQDQLPEMIRAWAGGSSLQDFVADLNPELVDMVLTSGTLPATRAEQLKRVSDALRAKREAAASNGVASSAPQQGEQAS